jgi:hypothetical protein
VARLISWKRCGDFSLSRARIGGPARQQIISVQEKEHLMRQHIVRLGRSTLVGLVVLTAAAAASGCSTMHKDEKSNEAHEKKLMPSDVPPKVMSAMDTRFPGAQYTSITKEDEKGTTIYDFELTQSGHKFEADVKEDGTIAEIERAIDAKDLPPAVAQAVKQKYPNATWKDVMEKRLGTQETPHEYEIALTTAKGKDEEVTIKPDGKIVHE